ncbi:MAG: formylglycine-generating enzyme family protein [Planctomycetota bacterium]|nr:MAG: formylglycine-generating enzyme family protein [Planctomycetota bacterium]
MRVAFVIVALLFFMAGCSQKEIQKEVAIEMELIGIPAGTVTMGSPADEKNRFEDEEQVSVTLTKPFSLGKTEVTQGQWKEVMGTEPWDGQKYVKADKDCPATYVNWGDATEFCKKLTAIERKSGKLKADEEYRLPTEAEWEYACRAGTETAFSYGDDESKLGEYAWWGGFDLAALTKGEVKAGGGNAAREQYAHTVGTKKPNPWGLHDMHGNVAEWCSDWYGDSLAGGTDPVGPEEGSSRVFRGGGWWPDPGFCRSARRVNLPSDRRSFLGFRVARSQSAQ